MPTSIEGLWADLAHVGQFPAHRRISADHPLDLYAEVSPNGRIGLLAVCDEEPRQQPRYESVDVEIGKRTDGRWAVRLALARRELTPLFARLCDDIVESGRVLETSSNTGEFVLARLARWRRLLDLGPSGLLAETGICGLAGELLFLKKAVKLYGGAIGVSGWNGPFDAPQDFDLPPGHFEIKAVRHGAATVHISSLDQLDLSGGTLTLVVYEFKRASVGSSGSITLVSLVDELRHILDSESAAFSDFESRLKAAGYEQRQEYGAIAYSVERLRYFVVKTGFPRLIRSELSNAFAAVTYELLLARCEPFRSESLDI